MRPFDASGVFHPTAKGDRLRRLAVRGAGVTVFSGGVALCVQVVSTVVLARLLTPSDFGVVTMVSTFSLLLSNFGFNGFTEAVIQKEEIDQSLVSNLFWINLVAGLLLTVGFAAAGSLLARFYGDPRVVRVAVGMSLTIVLTTLSVQHLALLKRAMLFHLVSINDIAAAAVSVVVSIVLGWAGWGYWALVAGAVARPLSQFVGAWSLCRWLPSFPRRAAGTAPMVQFALRTYGRFMANYCTWNLDNLLIGWRLGPVSLGFYKKAYDLFSLSVSQTTAPLTSVAVSALSRLNNDRERYQRYFLGAFGVTAFLSMGLGADLFLIGRDLIRLLLGPQWAETGRIFRYFCPGIGVMLLYYTHGWIHLSIGRADRWLRWGFVEFGVTALLFVLALPWGAVGIAVAWTLSFWILTLPSLWYAGRPIQLGIAPVLAAVWRYILASLMAGWAAWALIPRLPLPAAASGPVVAIVRILMISVGFLALYLAAVILLHRGYAPLDQVVRLLQEMVPWSRFSKSSAAAAPIGSPSEIAVPTFSGEAR